MRKTNCIYHKYQISMEHIATCSYVKLLNPKNLKKRIDFPILKKLQLKIVFDL